MFRAAQRLSLLLACFVLLVTSYAPNVLVTAQAPLLSEVTRINTGLRVTDVAVNSSTNRTYVVGYTGTTGLYGVIKVIDGNSNAVIDTISIGKSIYDVAVNSKTNRIYVLADSQDGKLLYAYNGLDNSYVTVARSEGGSLQIDEVGNRVFSADLDNLKILNGADLSNIKSIPISGLVDSIVFNPRTNRVYVSWLGSRSSPPLTNVINVSTNTYEQLIDDLYIVAANPSTARLYATKLVSDLLVLDDETYAVVSELPYRNASSIRFSSTGNRMFFQWSGIRMLNATTHDFLYQATVGYLYYPFALNDTTNTLYVPSVSEIVVLRDNSQPLPPPPADTDGDGLLDTWEQNGIDANGDGIVDLPLHQAPYNANPYRKDVFIEVDFMVCMPNANGCMSGRSHQPQQAAMEAVITVFDQAPVKNPNGERDGIALHIMVDEAVPEIERVLFTSRGAEALDDFDDIKLGSNHPLALGKRCGTGVRDGHFGTTADRSNQQNCENILSAREKVFRYAVFGHSLYERPGSSGQAEEPGNDFIITLGSWDAFALGAVDGLAAAEAATFMHELGHTLGLSHGGGQQGEEFNCKPNYFSVMNYSYQFTNFSPIRPLDYSRTALSTLNENGLNEEVGVGGLSSQYVVYNSEALFLTRANTRIDWNNDGNISNSVTADINYITSPEVNLINLRIDRQVICAQTPNQLALEGHDDWSSLQYSVNRLGGNFSNGVTRSTVASELTFEQALAMAHAVDFDQDGARNLLDNCPAIANPDQLDDDADGVGNACSEESIRFDVFLPSLSK